MTDNQPRYTTKRMHDEIAKAKVYGIELALEAVAAFRCDTGEFLPRDQVIAAIRSMKEAPSDLLVGSVTAAEEAQMALCQLSWVEEGGETHPRRIECIRKALLRLASTEGAPE